jgi:hypothetical protein
VVAPRLNNSPLEVIFDIHEQVPFEACVELTLGYSFSSLPSQRGGPPAVCPQERKGACFGGGLPVLQADDLNDKRVT